MKIEILNDSGEVLLKSDVGNSLKISILEFWQICREGARLDVKEEIINCLNDGDNFAGISADSIKNDPALIDKIAEQVLSDRAKNETGDQIYDAICYCARRDFGKVEDYVYGWLNEQPEVLDVASQEYKENTKLVEGLCNEVFPDLSQAIFGGCDFDLIFRDRNDIDKYCLYYYNPDANAGGQIVKCEFDNEAVGRMYKGEDYLDVLAEYSQYLNDIDTRHFFDTIFELIDMKQQELYLGNNVAEFCKAIVQKESSLKSIIDNATQRSLKVPSVQCKNDVEKIIE